jgi:hypothetical protein
MDKIKRTSVLKGILEGVTYRKKRKKEKKLE